MSGLFGDCRAVGLNQLLHCGGSPLCAARFSACLPASAPLATLMLGLVHQFWYHICKPCYPGSGWRRLLCPARHPGLGDCWRLCGRAKACILKSRPLASRPHLRLTPEVPLTTMSGHHLGSVDGWLCQILHQIFGGSPAGYPRFVRVSRRGFPPLEARMQWACYWRQRRSGSAADRALGNSVGAIEMVACSDCALRAVEVGDWGCFVAIPFLVQSGRFGGLAAAFRRCRRTIVTWLILPVVICLSQRLSHACLSISNYTVKLRMAH